MDNKINGLTDKQVMENRKKYGSNQINNDNKNNLLSLFIESLGDPIIKILLIALAVKIIFFFRDFDWFETLGILIAIFIASFISTISEFGSEKAFEKLQEESMKLKCRVKRNNKIIEVPISDIVKDDIVLLSSGDKVPADGTILSGEVAVNESMINGEPKEVIKYDINTNNKNKVKNTLYKGTVIYSGNCMLLVTKVGENTFYGKIASELKEKAGESPLKIRLRNLAKLISMFGYVGAFLASISYLFSVIVVNNNFVLSDIINTITNFPLMANYIIYALTLCVTIIIVAVPEGLPMMITLVLSSNMKRMVKNNVLVRKMVGIETSGSINVLFSDKTGTITTGMMSCEKIIDGNLNEYKKETELTNKYAKILKTSMIVNNDSIYDKEKIIGGNITDRALLSFFKPTKVKVKKIKEVPFNSKNKYMITVIDDKNIKNLIKGAPEILLDKCKYYYDENGVKKIFLNKNKILNIINKNTKNGTRVILLATSNHITETLFKDLVFVGVVLIKDTIRKEAKDAINLVKKAGVHTIMITGDNKDTAFSIAKEVGLIESSKDIVLTHDDLEKTTDEELKRNLFNIKVIARSFPQDKSRLVRVAQEKDLVVGAVDGENY